MTDKEIIKALLTLKETCDEYYPICDNCKLYCHNGDWKGCIGETGQSLHDWIVIQDHNVIRI